MNSSLRILMILLICASAALFQCNEENSVDSSTIGLQKSGTAVLQGAVSIGESAITYESVAVNDARSIVTVTVDGAVLEADIDLTAQIIKADGHNATLTGEQKSALLTLAQDLYTYLSARKSDISAHEFSLIRLAEYWAEAPDGYVYGSREVRGGINGIEHLAQAAASCSKNEGITCIRKNTWVTAVYDDSKGCHSESVLVGSTARPGYECMGRCGGGCGWGAPSSWTKDCMDHDQCSNKNYSSGGGSDSNCGDEYNEAMDDWTWGVWRGCNGN